MGRSVTDSFATKSEVKDLRDLMTLVIVVLFIGFAAAFIAVGAMVTSALADKQATSQAIRDQIKDQNDKIEVLTARNNELTKTIQDQTKAIQDVQKTLQTTN